MADCLSRNRYSSTAVSSELSELTRLQKFLNKCRGKRNKKQDVLRDLTDLRWVVNFVTVMMVLVYFLCRLYMLVEVVRALFYLPPAAFLTAKWLAAIPHIS